MQRSQPTYSSTKLGEGHPSPPQLRDYGAMGSAVSTADAVHVDMHYWRCYCCLTARDSALIKSNCAKPGAWTGLGTAVHALTEEDCECTVAQPYVSISVHTISLCPNCPHRLLLHAFTHYWTRWAALRCTECLPVKEAF